jgi:DNA-binding transcriptional LysR family regulator
MMDRGMLEADALRAFAAFSEHLNFTTAAAELLISQPALHVKIRKLSASLGVELYERQGRRLVLTETGHRLAEFSLEHRRRVDDFLAGLYPANAPAALAAGRSTLRWVIGEGIQRLVTSGRAVRVVTAGRDEALQHVNAGRVDLAVIAHTPPPQPLEQCLLSTYPQVLVVPRQHRLGKARAIRLTDLDGLDLVLPPRGRPHRESLETALRAATVKWQVTAEVDGWDLLVHFVRLGLGATVVNGCVPAPEGLVAIPVSDLPRVSYWATWRSPRQRLVSEVMALLAPNGPGARSAVRQAPPVA